MTKRNRKRPARLAERDRRETLQTHQSRISGGPRDGGRTLADVLGIEPREAQPRHQNSEKYYIARFLFHGRSITKELRREFPDLEQQNPDGHLVLPLLRQPRSLSRARDKERLHEILQVSKRQRPAIIMHVEGISFGEVESGQLCPGAYSVMIPFAPTREASSNRWSAQLTEDITILDRISRGLGVNELPRSILIGTTPEEQLAAQARQFLNEGGFFAGEFSLTGAQVCPVPPVDAAQRM